MQAGLILAMPTDPSKRSRFTSKKEESWWDKGLTLKGGQFVDEEFESEHSCKIDNDYI